MRFGPKLITVIALITFLSLPALSEDREHQVLPCSDYLELSMEQKEGYLFKDSKVEYSDERRAELLETADTWCEKNPNKYVNWEFWMCVAFESTCDSRVTGPAEEE